ncbi:MAG TPA: glycosyltransferase family 4 protein [Candidatus Saccharimonadales bacterium]|nr:glycosyltransferase family 4 protein [Candidatus Saccharimonadales bacterium]
MLGANLKIGLVLDDSLDKTDGVQQYVLALGEWLSAQGHEVHYLVGETHRHDIPRIHSLSKNVKVRFNRNRLSMPLPAKRAQIRDLLRQESFDVLHVQMPYSPWLAGRIIRAAEPQTAVVGTFHIAAHSALVARSARLLAIWQHWSLKRFDKIVSVSKAAATFAAAAFGIKSTILPNVIDYQRFSKAKPFSKYQDGVPTILFLGRLVSRKGCLMLLEAVNQLTRSDPDLQFRVLICGAGPLETSLKHYVTSHNLSPRVEFTGFVSEADKPRYYASADIAVFPSTGGESFGIVLVEALASGRTAVLAGDNAGYRSVLSANRQLLFSTLDKTELVNKLRLLLTNEAARKSVAIWGAEFAKQFDTAKVGDQLLKLYKAALLKRRGVQ